MGAGPADSLRGGRLGPPSLPFPSTVHSCPCSWTRLEGVAPRVSLFVCHPDAFWPCSDTPEFPDECGVRNQTTPLPVSLDLGFQAQQRA